MITATLALLLLPMAAAQAQSAPPKNPAQELASDPQARINDTLRQQLEVIGRYANEVSNRSAPATAAVTPRRQIDIAVDPFEVSPQLREGRQRTPFSGLPGANVLELKRRVQLRAVIRTSQGTLAQLLVNDKDVVTIMDKELVDLGDMGTFQAEIHAGAVSLTPPGSPQKKVVLR